MNESWVQIQNSEKSGGEEMEKHELHFYPKQSITLNDLDADGLILDIAGGGEGVIAQLKEDQVIAIDKKVREL